MTGSVAVTVAVAAAGPIVIAFLSVVASLHAEMELAWNTKVKAEFLPLVKVTLAPRLIPELAYRPLGEMVKLPMVANHLGPLLERHRRSIEILRERIEARDGVIFFDVSDLDLEGYNKFIPYLLHPECVYSVSVSASAARAKISLGTNPWKQETADQNLASLAEKFGGGGHPRVSAISFDPADLPRAREIARGLTATLRGK